MSNNSLLEVNLARRSSLCTYGGAHHDLPVTFFKKHQSTIGTPVLYWCTYGGACHYSYALISWKMLSCKKNRTGNVIPHTMPVSTPLEEGTK